MIIPVLHNLKSPQNVGAIVRSHRAFGGTHIAFVGSERPWQFKKSTQAFSRRLESQLDIINLPDDAALFDWCDRSGVSCVALEISASATSITEYNFPVDVAIICGNESTGLEESTRVNCVDTIVIPQTGPVGSLNVATACSIALYSYSVQHRLQVPIDGHKFVGESQIVG